MITEINNLLYGEISGKINLYEEIYKEDNRETILQDNKNSLKPEACSLMKELMKELIDNI